MRVAVVGSGGAGMTCTWLLQDDHDVTLFEAAPRLGGHIHTHWVDTPQGPVPVEVGAEFVFDQGYGGLHALLARCGLETRRVSLSASVTMEQGRGTFVMPPRDGAALRSCLSRETLRDLYWLARLSGAASAVVEAGEWTLTVHGLLARVGVPREVADRMIVPLIGSSWGVSTAMAAELSAYSVVRVMGLGRGRRPHMYTLARGLGSYIDALAADSPRATILPGTPVRAIDRDADGVRVQTDHAASHFDAVVLACDWHNSAALCADSAPLAAWAEAFGAFEDYPARVAVHRDASRMPPDRRLWQKGNYFFSPTSPPRTTVWSGMPLRADVFRTWLRPGEPAPDGTVLTADYRHVLMTPQQHTRQARLAALQGTEGVYAAGMYTDGVDNHESALRSALRVSERLAPEGARTRWLAPRLSS